MLISIQNTSEEESKKEFSIDLGHGKSYILPEFLQRNSALIGLRPYKEYSEN
jgi:hypothetical protein